MTNAHAGHRVDVYVRAFEPVKDEHRAAVERLQALQDDGSIAAVSVRTWPNKIRLSERSIATDLVELYERFADWAADNDLSIHPPFEVRETGFELLDDRDEVLILPGMVVVVSAGEEILGLYPCRAADRRLRINDCLDALEAGDPLPS